MKLDRIKLVILFALLFLPACVNKQALASTAPECSWYEAEYKPHPSYKSGNPALTYALTVKRNPSYVPTSGPKAFVTLKTYSISKEPLSDFVMDYVCTSGSVGRCFIKTGDQVSDHLPVQFLKQDFTPVFNLSKAPAPYAIVLPEAAAIFGGINKKKSSRLVFYTEEKVAPNFSVPSVWMFNKCN